MNKRDNFSAKTREILAQRCAYLCSNPNCREVTIGAHSQKDKTISIGRACHIEAASEGGPRYNKDMSSEQRKSIDNGIWLCAKCSDIIDSDVNKYTVDILKEWKINSEKAMDSTNVAIKKKSMPQIVSIANLAGGTGKSVVSGMLSIAISRVTKKKILCISATQLDHALKILGFWGNKEEYFYFLKESSEDIIDLKIYNSPLYDGVDAVYFSDVKEIAFQQHLRLGKTDLMKVLYDIAEKNEYDYIVCDCGRGIEIDTAKELLLSSSDIVFPLGQHIHAINGIEMMCDNLKNAEYNKNIWILHSIGYLTSNQKLNIELRQQLLDVLKKFKNLFPEINEFKTVIPKNNALEKCLWAESDIFSCTKTKDIVEAYEELVKELLNARDDYNSIQEDYLIK
jgi:cellulose biosynthesis protein BcsQ